MSITKVPDVSFENRALQISGAHVVVKNEMKLNIKQLAVGYCFGDVSVSYFLISFRIQNNISVNAQKLFECMQLFFICNNFN